MCQSPKWCAEGKISTQIKLIHLLLNISKINDVSRSMKKCHQILCVFIYQYQQLLTIRLHYESENGVCPKFHGCYTLTGSLSFFRASFNYLVSITPSSIFSVEWLFPLSIECIFISQILTFNYIPQWSPPHRVSKAVFISFSWLNL